MSDPDLSVNEIELEDLAEEEAFGLGGLDLSWLKSPVAIRALAGIAVAAAVLMWPGRTDRILARLIGLALGVVASTSLWSQLRARPVRLVGVVASLIGVLGAVWLQISPNHSEVALGRFVGIALIAVGLRDLVGFARSPSAEQRLWTIARSIAMGCVGALVILFPSAIFAALTTLGAIIWIGLSAVVLVACFSLRLEGDPVEDTSTSLLRGWLDERPKSAGDRQELYDKILFEGPNTTRRLVRFFALMAFAAVIASMGVITDSTAVVIGAMLIAPLMTPLMGMAISLVMGWPRRLARSGLVAFAGILVAIGIGVLLGWIVPSLVDSATNSQILARSTPTTLDLITALAAGAAGAYGLSRPDVSDSLPGVAIAISLVPPLTVVGISYSQGDWAAGNGALLLFATNVLAILVMGGLTFVLTGVTPVRRVADNQHRVRTAVAALCGVSAIVVGGLMLNGAEIATDAVEQTSARAAVASWLDDYPNYSLVRLVVTGNTVTATVVGPSDSPPSAQSLAKSLSTKLDHDITADLRLIVEERDIASVRRSKP